MIFERKVVDIGGALYVLIPKDIAVHHDFKRHDEVMIKEETGKHGPYLTIWKKGE